MIIRHTLYPGSHDMFEPSRFTFDITQFCTQQIFQNEFHTPKNIFKNDSKTLDIPEQNGTEIKIMLFINFNRRSYFPTFPGTVLLFI